MADHVFDDKGKVKPTPSQETEQPQKDNSPLTMRDMQGNLDAKTVTKMQRTLGNAAVQRFLAQRSAEGSFELDEGTTESINAERGGGQKLDRDVAEKAGAVMGQDFSDVNVHTGSQSHELNQQVGAKAFTVGNDVFFKDGEYNPSSSDGQRLIAHELTHVVQQGGSAPSVQGKMTVNDPNDAYEQEADTVADAVVNQGEAAVQRQVPEEEEPIQAKLAVQREVPEEEMAMKVDPTAQRQEEEEAMQMKPDLQRQEEEEAMQMKPDLQRQEEEEAMQMKPDLQRQEEEEAMQMKPDLQRQEEEEMMQMKPDMQRQDEGEIV
ncbi:MAG: DUF4157 domain-containing protein [Candidatus Promineifilaceae bacterium]|nr:DUF4157 domain-containing protein [Candidatus Promineifilaceae bacterium]